MRTLKDFNIFRYQLDIIFMIALCPLYNAFVGSYGVFQILTIPLILLFAYYWIVKKNRAPLKDYVVIFMIILFQDVVLTLSVGQISLIQELKVYIIVLLVMLHAISFPTSRIIYPFMALVGVIVGYYMLTHQDLLDGVRLSLQIGETLQDPNWIAVFLFAPFCYGLKLLISSNIFHKTVGVFCFAFSVYIVFLTGSRGALLGIMMAFLVWLRFSIKQTRVVGVIVALGSIYVLAYIFFVYFVPNINAGILERYFGGDSVVDDSRKTIWLTLLTEYSKGNLLEIILGRGPGSCVRDLGMSAHNIFLEQLFQMGLVGLFLMVLFIAKLFKDTLRCNNLSGLYMLTALFTLSLTTPLWGHIYFMTPLAMVIYVNNAITLEIEQKRFSRLVA